MLKIALNLVFFCFFLILRQSHVSLVGVDPGCVSEDDIQLLLILLPLLPGCWLGSQAMPYRTWFM